MRTTTVVIGAGHSGLAVSHFLSARSIDHVVLERGEVANSWRTERWDSLRLLTPNWKTGLPGLPYDGKDPDGYMTMPEVVDFIDRYARLLNPPLETLTTVLSVRKDDEDYEVVTDRGDWLCRSVVLASGGFNLPKVPPIAAAPPHFGRLGDLARLPPALGSPGRGGAGGGGSRPPASRSPRRSIVRGAR